MTNKKTGRIALRVEENVALVFEELQGLGVNTSELVREMLNASLPSLKVMAKAVRAQKAGRPLDARAALEEMAVGLVTQMMKD